MLECGKMDCNVIEMVEPLSCEDNGRPSVDSVGNIHDSDPRICVNCPTRHLCIHSKDCVKTV